MNTDSTPQLSHEKLEVYQKALVFVKQSTEISSKLPRGNAELVEQQKRAALSILLNIAEACGRTGSLDNAKHFTIARGSALESGAIIDACHALSYIDGAKHLEVKRLIVSIVAMLSKLCIKK